MIKVRNDLSGDIIGNFLVLNQEEDYVSPKGYRRVRWKCKCLLCGNNDVIIMDTVLKKQSKESCGCLDDLTNKRFEKLLVVGEDGKDENGNTIWKCSCDCGNVVSYAHNRLTSGNVKSCGCLRRELTGIRFSKENKYDLSGKCGVGWTSNTNKEFYFDLEDYDKIKDYTWFEDVSADNYHSLRARVKGTTKNIKMSEILGYKNYDHKNRNPLDNRKGNFRLATAQENARNRSLQRNNKSGFTGVCEDKESGKWLAYIEIDSKQTKLGRFVNKEDAIRARLRAEKEYYGEFASQRHLFKEYGIEDEFLEGSNG